MATGYQSKFAGKQIDSAVETIVNFNLENGEGTGSLSLIDLQDGKNTNKATGIGSVALGQNNKTYANSSYVEGSNNTINQDAVSSHVEGDGNISNNRLSHTEGKNNINNARGGHIEGYNNNLSGDYAHLGGLHNKGSEQAVFAHGKFLNVTKFLQSAFGTYNDPTYIDDGQTAMFQIGNGTSNTNRRNAFQVLWDGRAVVQTAPKSANDVARKTELDNKYDKAGGAISGDVTIGGNLTVNGTTTTIESQTLSVKDKLIEVASGNTEMLTTPAGLVVPKYDGVTSGALVFDGRGTAYVGDVTLDAAGNIDVNNSDLEPLATRSENIENGNIVKWDNTRSILIDTGINVDNVAKLSDIIEVTANPSSSATDTLAKLKVGDTTYNIPQNTGSTVEVKQTTGQSTSAVMSQKAVTDELSGKLNKVTGSSVVYVNGGAGTPTTIGFAENTAPASSMVRRNIDGAVVATNLAMPFNDITKLSNNLGKRVVYVGGDKTLSKQSKIIINSNIYDIDFNGATITVNQGELALVANTFDGLIKGHGHCIIHNLNLKVNIAPYSTNTALTGYNVLDTFGGIENVLVTINSSATSSGSVNLTLRGIANADHISNTKVDLDCTTTKVTSICYAYCNYLVWARADGDNKYSFAECNYLTNCINMSNTPAGSNIAFLNCNMLSNCSYQETEREGSEFYYITRYTSTVGKSPLDSIQDTNEGKTKAYVKPAGGSGIAPLIDVDTEPTDGSIVRRITGGQIRAAAAKGENDVTTLSQLTSYVQGNPTQTGTTTLTKVKIADIVYNIPQGGSVDAYTKSETDALLKAKANTSDIPTVSTLGKTGQLKDGTQDATHRLVTDTEKSTWNGKQAQLTTAQLNAANSGITSSKVSTYDGYATTIGNKVDKVTGKGLSTNDYTTTEKTKLMGIETGAEVNKIDTIVAGDNITVTKSGKTVTISATGGGGGSSSNALKVTIW